MTALAPLAFGVPLLAAALLCMLQAVLSRLAADLCATAVAVAEVAITLLLLLHVQHGPIAYWFGGWRPRAGVAIGIDFAVGPLGCGLAVFISLLSSIALLYSTRFIEVPHPHYHVLMLTFMAGMIGFCLSGDLFNMFVAFELMSVAAVALIGYKIREQAALEGALNFAVINMIGSFMFLLGIGFVYAKTGALNLAQIGRAVSHAGDDRVIIVAFVLIACALLIKAAVVPFHFWLADAYAVALAPVCILLAGAMSEIGVYGLARVWYSAFAPGFRGELATVRAIFVGAGVITALWGAAMALAEDHLKRMLAFVTISATGAFLAGVGLLSGGGLAGASVYVIADGFSKALLFACVGILQSRLGSVSQRWLHGRGRRLPATGAMFAAGGALIAALPPFGPFLGKSMLDDAAIKAGYGFLPALIMIASALCGAAVLRAAGRVFCGWGAPEGERRDVADEDTRPESEAPCERTPAVMFVPAMLLLAGAVGTGVWFGFGDLVGTAANRFVDVRAYQATVFGAAEPLLRGHSSAPEWYDWLYCGGSALLAAAVAALGLWGRRSSRLVALGASTGEIVLRPLRRVHTGRVGDYAAALLLGVGVLCALMMLTLR